MSVLRACRNALLQPTRPALLFALRTSLAMLAALALAAALGLDSPQWAAMTVGLVAQPTRGLQLAKGFYRLLGTLLGALVVELLLRLAQQPALALAGLALWLGLCAGAAQWLRGIRAYAAVLAGYTPVIVALPAFAEPGRLDEFALARVGCIAIGVAVSTLLSSGFTPGADVREFRARVRDLGRATLAWTAGALRGGDESALAARERELLAELAALDARCDQVGAGSDGRRTRVRAARELIAAALLLVARTRALQPLLAAQPGGPALAARLAEVLDGGRAAPAASATALLAGELAAGPLRTRLDEFAEALAAAADARRAGEQATAVGLAPRPHPHFHRDRALAWHAARRAGLAVAAVAAFWQLSGWAGGLTMLMSCAVMCSIFAASDRAFAGLLAVLRGSVAGVACALLGKLWLLAGVDSFAWQLLGIVPVLFAGCLLIASPPTAITGTDFTMLFLLMFNPVPGAAPASLDHLLPAGLGAIAGVAWVALVYRWLLPSDPPALLRRLVRECVHDLRRLAMARRPPNAALWRARTLGRVLRLVARSAVAGEAAAATLAGGIAALTAGLALLRLHQCLPALDAVDVQAVRALFAACRDGLNTDPAALAVLARRLAASLSDADGAASLAEFADALERQPAFFRSGG